MKKKWICTMLALALSAALFTGCGSSFAKDKNDTGNETEQPSGSDDISGGENPSGEEDNTGHNGQDDTAPDENAPGAETPNQEPTEDFENMTELKTEQFALMEKALDSLMVTCTAYERTYDSQDADFFWQVISYGVQYHTEEIPLAEVLEEEIRLPRMAVQEFATGLFADYQDLPQLPEGHPTVRYDADWDAYVFSASSCMIPFETQLLNAYEKEDGQIRIAALLNDTDTGKPLRCYIFHLVLNAYADGITDPIFPYSVSSMTLSPAVNTGGELSTLIGSFQGFSDNHTVEFLIDGNLMAFQVYDKEIISLLSGYKEGQEVTFAVEIDKATESKTIASLIFK